MNDVSPRRRQHGYLMEIPILLMIIGVVVAFVLPKLPAIGQKILLGIAVVPVILALYYMIIIPGWTPNSSGRLKPLWNWLAFLLIAGSIIGGVLLFILA